MLRLLAFIVVLAVIVAAAGLYRGWFHVSSTSTNDSSGLTVTVDKTKVREDEQRAKEKAESLKEQVQSKPTTRPAARGNP